MFFLYEKMGVVVSKRWLVLLYRGVCGCGVVLEVCGGGVVVERCVWWWCCFREVCVVVVLS